MNSRRRPLTAEEGGMLIGMLAVLLGAFIYLYPPSLAGFPINDGGLFYSMIKAVMTAGFSLPASVDYNGLTIPFAYPPLGFYAAGLLSAALRVDPLVILQWLPAAIAIATTVCFFFAARQLMGSPIGAGIATFLYVCTPRSATWLIMGGGLTRGFGQLFMLLTLAAAHRMFIRRTWRSVAATSLAGALVVLSHPEAALHTVALVLGLWLICARNRRAAMDAAIVALGVLLLTAIWWGPVLGRHGAAPLLSAAQTGLHNSLAFVYPLFMMWTEEPAMTIIAALGVIGFFYSLARQGWLLPVWLLAPFLVEPRSAPTVAIIPLAMLAGQALHAVILPAIAAGRGQPPPNYLSNGVVKGLVGYLEAFLLVMAVYAGMMLARVRVSPANLDSLDWVKNNTPLESRFLVLTGATELFCDPVQEWFPVLANRISATTIQGNEWLGSDKFLNQMARLQQVQLCVDGAEPANCLITKSALAGLQFDHVYVVRTGPDTRGCRAEGEQRSGEALLAGLRSDPHFVTVYETAEVEILRVRP